MYMKVWTSVVSERHLLTPVDKRAVHLCTSGPPGRDLRTRGACSSGNWTLFRTTPKVIRPVLCDGEWCWTAEDSLLRCLEVPREQLSTCRLPSDQRFHYIRIECRQWNYVTMACNGNTMFHRDTRSSGKVSDQDSSSSLSSSWSVQWPLCFAL